MTDLDQYVMSLNEFFAELERTRVELKKVDIAKLENERQKQLLKELIRISEEAIEWWRLQKQ